MKKVFQAGKQIITCFWYLIGYMLLMLVVLELFFFSCFFLIKSGQLSRDHASHLPDWYGDYWHELMYVAQHMQWDPYLQWRGRAYNGQYIHVGHDSRRRTWSPPAHTDAASWTIFMFGGSTMWGYGARDNHTIPSQLSQILHQHAVNANIVNFGEFGYINTQSMLQLIQSLKKGEKPDWVIFYDGVNDVFSRFARLAQLSHRKFEVEKKLNQSVSQMLIEHYMKHSNIKRALAQWVNFRTQRHPPEVDKQNIDETIDHLIAEYRENIHFIHNLANIYQFKVLFCWQPMIFFKRHLTKFEHHELVNTLGTQLEPLKYMYVQTHAALFQSNTSHSTVFDLSHLFQDNQALLFLDPWHVTETANQQIAKAISQKLLMN